jgi:hypothetical protein
MSCVERGEKGEERRGVERSGEEESKRKKTVQGRIIHVSGEGYALVANQR